MKYYRGAVCMTDSTDTLLPMPLTYSIVMKLGIWQAYQACCVYVQGQGDGLTTVLVRLSFGSDTHYALPSSLSSLLLRIATGYLEAAKLHKVVNFLWV